MKNIVNISIGVALISLIIGIISRLALKPVFGLMAHSFLGFSAVCLLLAIALSVKDK